MEPIKVHKGMTITSYLGLKAAKIKYSRLFVGPCLYMFMAIGPLHADPATHSGRMYAGSTEILDTTPPALYTDSTAHTHQVDPFRPTVDAKNTPDSLSLKFASQQFLNDGLSLMRRPLGWTASHHKKLLGKVAITVGLMAFDRWTYTNWQPHPPTPARSDMKILASPGNGSLYLPLAGLLYLHARVIGDVQQARVGVGLASSVIWTRLLIQIPKYAFQRERPLEGGENARAFHGPFGGYRHNAFPSGHTATAFAAAAYLRGVRPYNKTWPGQAATILAAATAFQRLQSGEHWLTDVVAGAWFGQACGTLFARQVSGFKISASPCGTQIIIPIGQRPSK